MKQTFKVKVILIGLTLDMLLNFSTGSACKWLCCWGCVETEKEYVDPRTLPSPRSRVSYVLLENRDEQEQSRDRQRKSNARSGSGTDPTQSVP